jgi:predicted ArsR family transcriptional regulator
VSTWQAVAVLVDPVRRALFDCVRRRDRPVSREEAADVVGVSRPLAAFHLDKLVEAGLLSARYEAPDDRPRGRGRTPKVYEAVADVDLTLPPRRYELLASVLADAVASSAPPSGSAAPSSSTAPSGSAASSGTDASATAMRLAHVRGVEYGRSLGNLETALNRLGFEPTTDDDGTVLLDNCPFHAVAVDHPELVCGLNLAFVDGLLDGVGGGTRRAELAPRPGHCCVEIKRD